MAYVPKQKLHLKILSRLGEELTKIMYTYKQIGKPSRYILGIS